MDKITQAEFERSLQDVRLAYRLLAVYQRRLLDTVDFIFKQFSTSEGKWYGHFSNPATNAKTLSLKSWSWDWLPMYFSQFKSLEQKIGVDKYYLQIIHMADSGYFDVDKSAKISKIDVDQFVPVASSESKLFFTFSKNDNEAPLHFILKDRIDTMPLRELVVEGNWAAISYPLKDFFDKNSTLKVVSELKAEFSKAFGIVIPRETL
ncbi:hypothetical protein [Algoriphagus mannitolivorans]|uniref:hypothetical protein n=1 Tax=Algoriphagus mannitolivorans TaxID=226504 RepID=UPI00042761FC|nr:hypothetical protein [Algoriphagus mannitolivorans]